ncbi:transketolase C-terminal domain-containing protein [Actinomadura gamaensis]|uniref:Transketolase C-terminal domain-containing protein n=1 Tax=Actinomadura gamaensis TaxID=1763541 RepID=A0ABV9U163_9ACTN
MPFDDATVCAAVRGTGRAVVVDEAAGFASVASVIAARVTERGRPSTASSPRSCAAQPATAACGSPTSCPRARTA